MQGSQVEVTAAPKTVWRPARALQTQLLPPQARPPRLWQSTWGTTRARTPTSPPRSSLPRTAPLRTTQRTGAAAACTMTGACLAAFARAGGQALDVSDRKPCMARPLCVRTGSQETVHDCMCRCIGPCLCKSPGPWASADWHAAAGGQSRYVGRHGWLDDSLPLWRSSAPRGGCAAERRAGAALLLRRATCRALLGALDAAGADCGAVLALVNPDGVGGGAVGLKVQLCSCVSPCSCWLPMPGKQGHMRGMPTGVGAQRRAPFVRSTPRMACHEAEQLCGVCSDVCEGCSHQTLAAAPLAPRPGTGRWV